MQTIIDFINNNLSFLDIPGTKIVIAAALIALALIFRRLFSRLVIKYVQALSQKTKTELDDAVIEALRKPLDLLIFLGGMWLAQVILAEHLSAPLSEFLLNVLNLALIADMALIICRSAKVLGEFLQAMTSRTRSEIDNLILPYVPTFIQALAILVVIIKASEVFLGMSATALLGLLGGAGITLGLVFKDVVSDWLSTLLIYSDNLYQAGDMITLANGSSGCVEKIGLRSTVIQLYDGPVTKIPNSQMIIQGITNWSQSDRWRAQYKLLLDGLSAKQVRKVTQGIREVLKSTEAVAQSWHLVHLSKIEGNSRVINIEYRPSNPDKVDADSYYDRFALAVEEVNLGILELLETLQIEPLTYTLFGNIDLPGEGFPVRAGDETTVRF